MSAASSWMMSGAVFDANWVTSLSCTESGSTGRYFTCTLGCAAFQDETISLVAAMVGSCHA